MNVYTRAALKSPIDDAFVKVFHCGVWYVIWTLESLGKTGRGSYARSEECYLPSVVSTRLATSYKPAAGVAWRDLKKSFLFQCSGPERT
jgi:hypothetical protein